MSTCGVTTTNVTGVLWKTVSEACNLACEYCYYSKCKGKIDKLNRIEDEVLEKFIKEYMAMSNGIASFVWQGGEPLLAGLDFFKKVVSLQAKYAKRNTMISNSIQTNGTLITPEWARFFKSYNFLVGVSLDGPKHLNDAKRVTGSGGGSFYSIMKGIQYLRDENVDFNILTVIHERNVTKGKELMEFYLNEQFTFVQFIPCMDFKSQEVDQLGRYTITPEQYGDFLCQVFDIWYNDGNPIISERFFDNMLAVYLHQEAEICIHRKTCPKTLILEQNGDAYPCDFYIHEDYYLGNVGKEPLIDIIKHKKFNEFTSLKEDLSEQCLSCEFLNLCHGGCPRARSWDSQKQTSNVEYFCQSYKQIYRYAHERMEIVADKVKERRLIEYIQKGGRLPERNELCICGSGKKYKKCCGKYKTLYDIT
ncbi:anaerobic sulfatase maturase [Bacillus sp. 1P02SD]|uniref:anaerobic sulfatase maturase n=1 Tax=Bacillus sp. 1P02SD TaxID=3132264 RepID=UPI0039A0BC15